MNDTRERQLTAYNDDISSSTFMRYEEDDEGESKDLEFTDKHSMNNTAISKKEGRETSKKRKHHKNRKLKPYQTMVTN
jgi:hypothetical protein